VGRAGFGRAAPRLSTRTPKFSPIFTAIPAPMGRLLTRMSSGSSACLGSSMIEPMASDRTSSMRINRSPRRTMIGTSSFLMASRSDGIALLSAGRPGG